MSGHDIVPCPAPDHPGGEKIYPAFDDSGQPFSLLWYLTLLGPFILTAVLLTMLYVSQGLAYVKGLLLTAVAIFFFFGRFVILGGEAGGLDAEASRFFSSRELALLVFYMDTMVASLLAFHIGFLFRIPFFGVRLRELKEDGKFILQANPWMKRATFAGIVTFVVFPLAATGSIGGSIFGRLLGMSRWGTFVGVVTGSALGCSLMYFGAALINSFIDRDNPLFTIGGILFVALVILLLNYRYRQMKAQWRAGKKPDEAAES